jgi:hypothetical protein
MQVFPKKEKRQQTFQQLICDNDLTAAGNPNATFGKTGEQVAGHGQQGRYAGNPPGNTQQGKDGCPSGQTGYNAAHCLVGAEEGERQVQGLIKGSAETFIPDLTRQRGKEIHPEEKGCDFQNKQHNIFLTDPPSSSSVVCRPV